MKRIIDIPEEIYYELVHKEKTNNLDYVESAIFNSTPLNECEAEDCISRKWLLDNRIDVYTYPSSLVKDAPSVYPKSDKPSCSTCEHNDEHNGENCYECVKGIKNNYLKSDKPLINEFVRTMRDFTPEEQEAINKAIRDMSYDTGVTLQGLLDHEKYIPSSVLEDIKAEIEDAYVEHCDFNYQLALDIIDKHIT